MPKKKERRSPLPKKHWINSKKEGYTRVAITSLDVIPGMEYAYDTAIYDLYKNDFKKMTVGTPIMYWMGQEDQRDDVAEFRRSFENAVAENGQSYGGSRHGSRYSPPG